MVCVWGGNFATEESWWLERWCGGFSLNITQVQMKEQDFQGQVFPPTSFSGRNVYAVFQRRKIRKSYSIIFIRLVESWF